uniref:Si:ch1073-224n8.1 n=1 Tax=Maylandia zebra TaxID=106582 RepID=A0A3P9CJ85_9CICH
TFSGSVKLRLEQTADVFSTGSRYLYLLFFSPHQMAAGSQRSFPHPLRHQRPMRECSSALGGLNGQKQLARTPGAGRGDSASSGGADDSAGPSAPDTAVVEPPGDRPHHCLECGKTFRLISSLKKHIRIHTGEKPYPCGVCGRRFRESGALKTHLRIHTGEKPYSCSECGNCFRHLDGLRKHRRTHTGEKPYVCAICGKRLSRLQHLKHHQLIHTGERPCCCPFCNRTFKEPAALRKHIRTHREEDLKLFSFCNICHKTDQGPSWLYPLQRRSRSSRFIAHKCVDS